MTKSAKNSFKKKIEISKKKKAKRQNVTRELQQTNDAQSIANDAVTRLTKDQRYYLRNKATINKKNAERNRNSRLKKRLTKDPPSSGFDIESTGYTGDDGLTQNERLSEDSEDPPTSEVDVDSNINPTQTERTEAMIEPNDMGLSLEDCLAPRPVVTEHLEEVLCGLSEYEPSLLRNPPEHLETILPRFPQHRTFLELRKSVQNWGSVWGGVNNWNHSLDIIFERALEEGYKASHDAVVDIFRQSQRGKRFLAGLDDLHGKLPSDNLAVALLWRYQDELVKILVKGVTILDCRLEYIESSLTDPDALSHSDYRAALGELTRTTD